MIFTVSSFKTNLFNGNDRVLCLNKQTYLELCIKIDYVLIPIGPYKFFWSLLHQKLGSDGHILPSTFLFPVRSALYFTSGRVPPSLLDHEITLITS